MTTPIVRTTAAKAWVSAIGTTLSALTTALTAVAIAVGDDAIDANEIGGLVVSTITLVSTVYGVWKVKNQPK